MTSTGLTIQAAVKYISFSERITVVCYTNRSQYFNSLCYFTLQDIFFIYNYVYIYTLRTTLQKQHWCKQEDEYLSITFEYYHY